MDTEKQHTKAFKPEIGRGCSFCNCGSECEAKLCDGCFKLHETAWLEEYPENLPTDIVEVRFKNTRRAFYQNVNNLPLKRGDIVAVEASPGHDIGIVSLTGDLVARQMRRTGFNPFNGEFKKIYRKAKPYDIEKWQEAIELEHETMIASRQIAADMGLNMKIGDVEYQGDKIKAIFYYIADERVDFRELIKVFAERFHIRIEMKQIGARQEAGQQTAGRQEQPDQQGRQQERRPRRNDRPRNGEGRNNEGRNGNPDRRSNGERRDGENRENRNANNGGRRGSAGSENRNGENGDTRNGNNNEARNGNANNGNGAERREGSSRGRNNNRNRRRPNNDRPRGEGGSNGNGNNGGNGANE